MTASADPSLTPRRATTATTLGRRMLRAPLVLLATVATATATGVVLDIVLDVWRVPMSVSLGLAAASGALAYMFAFRRATFDGDVLRLERRWGPGHVMEKQDIHEVRIPKKGRAYVTSRWGRRVYLDDDVLCSPDLVARLHARGLIRPEVDPFSE